MSFPNRKTFSRCRACSTPADAGIEVYSGADGQQCGWLALRDSDQRGLFTGWEFDGRTKTTVRQDGSKGYVQFSSTVLDLNHPVESNSEFQVPNTFIGLFHGDWDEAGYRTQRFVESVLAKPAPDSKTFPYVSWDSWAYQDKIDEQTLRRNADIAADLGVQLFIVDLGWARGIGDWHADPAKFPSGLGALSDYVHSLGMKFGLHFALAEADASSPVLQDNPDWTATDDSNYFGAKSLCLSNQPAQDWLIQEGIRMIDEYHVDWILQDGQNMVKQCTKTTHTHDPADSNYANAVQGINAVVSAIQQARPNVFWENCENGGNMMTFNMVKSYVTSITNDASGSLASRQAVYGATYPFPPRYAERYMPESDGFTPYATHSYRFGGPWVLMNQLADLPAGPGGVPEESDPELQEPAHGYLGGQGVPHPGAGSQCHRRDSELQRGHRHGNRRGHPRGGRRPQLPVPAQGPERRSNVTPSGSKSTRRSTRRPARNSCPTASASCCPSRTVRTWSTSNRS